MNMKYLAAGAFFVIQATSPVAHAQVTLAGGLALLNPIISALPVGSGTLGNINLNSFGFNFVPVANTITVHSAIALIGSVPELAGVLPSLGKLPIIGALPGIP